MAEASTSLGLLEHHWAKKQLPGAPRGETGWHVLSPPHLQKLPD